MWLIDHFRQYMAERRRAEQAEAQRRADMQQQIAAGSEAAHQHWLDNRDGYRRRQIIRAKLEREARERAHEFSVFGVLSDDESTTKAERARLEAEMLARIVMPRPETILGPVLAAVERVKVAEQERIAQRNAAQAQYDLQVAEMARRLDEETDLRMGRNQGRRNGDKVAP